MANVYYPVTTGHFPLVPGMPDSHDVDADLKVILLGDSAVGKTKLVERFLMDNYQPQQLSTYALTVFRHNAEVQGKPISVDFWDTAGQERFTSMHPSYYYGAHVCILAFDVTRKITYQNLNAWYKELRQYRPNIPVIVVANKIDADYKITEKTFAFPSKRKLPFYFCSASDGTNVVTLFNEAICMAYEMKQAPSNDIVDNVLEAVAYFEGKSRQLQQEQVQLQHSGQQKSKTQQDKQTLHPFVEKKSQESNVDHGKIHPLSF